MTQAAKPFWEMSEEEKQEVDQRVQEERKQIQEEIARKMGLAADLCREAVGMRGKEAQGIYNNAARLENAASKLLEKWREGSFIWDAGYDREQS